MNDRWLQIKGDPSVRRFLFEQTRHDSVFDQRMDALVDTVEALLNLRGVFHAKIHFSSNQLSCWLYHDPYRYRVFVGEEVFAPGFLDQFEAAVALERPIIPAEAVRPILLEFKRLRMKDDTVYLRNASINRINGMMGMTFSCDGSHYVPYAEFFDTVAQL
ncbi:MAG: hypothetical protein AB7U81_00460 [Thiohalomonadaceae bacterium]